MILGTIAQLILSGKQNKMQKKINPVYTPYESNPLAAQQLGLAQQMYGGRMAGAGFAEQNILGNQANAMGQVNRNSTDSSTALAMAAGLQGQSNNAFLNLQNQEGQDKINKFGLLSQSTGQMINEGDKVYQDKMMKYQQDLETKNSLISASMQNKVGAAKSFDNLLFAGAGLAMGNPGGLMNLFGGGKGGAPGAGSGYGAGIFDRNPVPLIR